MGGNSTRAKRGRDDEAVDPADKRLNNSGSPMKDDRRSSGGGGKAPDGGGDIGAFVETVDMTLGDKELDEATPPKHRSILKNKTAGPRVAVAPGTEEEEVPPGKNTSGTRPKSSKSSSKRTSWGANQEKEIPMRAGRETGVEEQKDSDASEAVGRTISIPAYDVSSYVVVTVSIAAGTPAEKVSLDWEEMIWKALELWHKTDKSICLLQPKDIHDGKRLYSRADT